MTLLGDDTLPAHVDGIRHVAVGPFTIGGGRCFVIGEAGVNHNGDVGIAHRLIDVAADTGVDAVKFQTFEPDLLVSRTASKAEYQKRNTGTDESQLEMLRALMLPSDAYEELVAHANERGVMFLSTPFDERSADFLEQLDVSAFKIASGELTNHRLLKHVASKGRPLLISTGMSTLDEVRTAVDVVRDAGNPPLALFHCVSNYPASPSDCNLRAMETMRRALGVPTGWSDHTAGVAIPIAAVALGADLLEKHFTLDRSMPGPDHAASLEPHELRAMMEAIRGTEAALGTGEKRPVAAELPIAALVRRSVHARRNLEAGHKLKADDLVLLRPAVGVPASSEAVVVGRRLSRAVAAGDPITESLLDA